MHPTTELPILKLSGRYSVVALASSAVALGSSAAAVELLTLSVQLALPRLVCALVPCLVWVLSLVPRNLVA